MDQDYVNIVYHIAYGKAQYRQIHAGTLSTRQVIGKDAAGQFWIFTQTDISYPNGTTGSMSNDGGYRQLDKLPTRDDPYWWFNPDWKE